MMLIEQRNPVSIEAVNKAMYFDKYLKELREYLYSYIAHRGQVCNVGQEDVKRRCEQIKDMFWKSSMVSDGFYRLIHKTIPLDVAVDVNIKMAKYLLEESITMNEYVFEVEEGVNWHFKRDFYGNLR